MNRKKHTCYHTVSNELRHKIDELAKILLFRKIYLTEYMRSQRKKIILLEVIEDKEKLKEFLRF